MLVLYKGEKQAAYSLPQIRKSNFYFFSSGEIPENIHSCLFWDCAFTARNPNESSQKEGHLLEGQHLCREGEEEEAFPGRAGTQLQKWHFYSSLKPKIPLEIFYMQQLYANPSQV